MTKNKKFEKVELPELTGNLKKLAKLSDDLDMLDEEGNLVRQFRIKAPYSDAKSPKLRHWAN